MRWLRPLLVLAGIVLASHASAGSLQIKPGLWKVENRVSAAGGQMGAAQAELQRKLAAMPPEQRKMMESMMASQGLKVGAGGPLEVSGRICMTQAMIDRHELPVQEGNCKTTLQSRTGNEMRMKFECTDPTSRGEGRYTIVSPEAYTMNMVVNATVEGKPEKMTLDARGTWLQADCGSTRPDTWSSAPK